jgi:hypothetical protein
MMGTPPPGNEPVDRRGGRRELILPVDETEPVVGVDSDLAAVEPLSGAI